MDVLIGVGAVGTVLAAYLGQAGAELVLLAEPERAQRLRVARQIQVDFTVRKSRLSRPAPVVLDSLDGLVPSRVLLATKATGLGAALDLLGPLPDSTVLIPCQNGVRPIALVRERYPDNPVRPMSVMFNARGLGPLHASLNSNPLVLCNDPGLARALAASGMTVSPWSESLAWGKLIINIFNAFGALTGCSINRAAADPDLGACIAAALLEAAATLRAAGIEFELPGGLSFGDYVHSYLGVSGEHFLGEADGPEVEIYASMNVDLDAGRPTEVDEFNGEIVRIGRRSGVPTPVNSAILALVRQAEQGELSVLPPASLRRQLEL